MVSRIDIIGQNGNDGDHYMKRVIIAGGRDYQDKGVLDKVMSSLFDIPVRPKLPQIEVVCGVARGADEAGANWAGRHGAELMMFPADWVRHGRSAGHIRNSQMADYADCLVAMWDGESRGTAHMIKDAKKKGLEVYVFNYEGVLIDTNTNT